MEFVQTTQKDAEQFNPSSNLQLQQLLFAPFQKPKPKEPLSSNEDQNSELDDLEATGGQGNEDEEVYGDDAPKRKVVRKELDEFPEIKAFQVLNVKVKIMKGSLLNLKKKLYKKHKDDSELRNFNLKVILKVFQ